MNARDRVQNLDSLRAERARRRQEVVVPFQVKALPAALEERIETPVVVLGGRPDKTLVEQARGLVADGLPVLVEFRQFRKLLERDHRLVRDGRARTHQYIVRREGGRVIAELTAEAEPLTAAEMHIHGRGRQQVKADELRGEKRFQHVRALEKTG